MSRQIGINIGFVTNSSSMVYHFPKSLLENPKVKAFLNAFEVADGFIGQNLWYRNQCGSFATTPEQKAELARRFVSDIEGNYGGPPSIDATSDSVVVVYGDEYSEMANILASMLMNAAVEEGLVKNTWDCKGEGYN